MVWKPSADRLPAESSDRPVLLSRNYRKRGFLPEYDPPVAFDPDSGLSMLDEVGRNLPSLLQKDDFRAYVRRLKIPPLPETRPHPEVLPQLRLYYLRVGFLASAYINQLGQAPTNLLPSNIAQPLCRVCRLLNRPPVLSYDAYALYNWKRFDKGGPVALGNIDTIQNFVHLYDEHWFILVHVEIEAIAARILDAIARIQRDLPRPEEAELNQALEDIAAAIWDQVRVLRRIPEKMDPRLYYKRFRPYIRYFENVVYEGVNRQPISFRGETGAQSSIMPVLVALMKIPHRSSLLTEHLADMRRYMPAEHRDLIEDVESMPSFRDRVEKDVFNSLLEAIASFREVHYGWAEEYINRRTQDPRGTGGTPYMQWLKQLIAETRAWMR
ncbi:MAG: hypothetical protein U9Q81_15570 [Pseudomonadota bacterium]|nr:hypothetical protein [Pseudomonadota bacterium]